MKHLQRTIIIVASLLWSLFAMATPEVMVNGEALASSPAKITINGDNVNVTFSDGSMTSFDMDDIVVNFSMPTDVATLQNKLFAINSTVENQLILSGVEAEKRLSVLSVSGISIYTRKTESNETRIDISNLASGVYLLNVDGKVVKFIKK